MGLLYCMCLLAVSAAFSITREEVLDCIAKSCDQVGVVPSIRKLRSANKMRSV